MESRDSVADIRANAAPTVALAAAAPDAFVQIAREDAEKFGIADGDWVRVTSRRGTAEAPAKVGDIVPGEVFIPFHYGYWDEPGRARAANELTIYEWDPVSKQPHYKYAAVRVEKIASPTAPQPARMDPAQPGVASPAAEESGIVHALKEAKDVLAVLLSIGLQAAARAKHPPAEATTLLIALGALQANARSAPAVLCGVVLVALVGEGCRRILRPRDSARQTTS